MSKINCFKSRELFSDSSLPNFIMDNGKDLIGLPFFSKNGLQISEGDFDSILKSLKNKILTEAHKLIEWSIYNVKKNHYVVGDDFLTLTLAYIFKHDKLFKNADAVNLDFLIKKIGHKIKNRQPVQMLIAWGQPKHLAGGLKAEGYNADSAELMGICFHLILVSAIKLIYKYGCELYLISGGTRFKEALFSNREDTEIYDKQRSLFVSALDPENSIKLLHYEDLKSEKSKVTNVAIECFNNVPLGIYHKILLSINWDKLMHGYGDVQLTIRKAIVDILINTKVSDKKYKETLADMEKIAAQSAIKYLTTQLQHDDKHFQDYLEKNNIHPIRLTVHNKKYAPEIPAFYVLGKKAGNQLPQHTSMMVSNGVVSYGTASEALYYGLKPVYLKKGNNKAFSWLEQQPFLYANNVKDIFNITNSIEL